MYVLDEQGKKNQIEEYAEKMIEREKYDRLQNDNPLKGEFDDIIGVIETEKHRPKHIFREENEFDNIVEAVILEKSPRKRQSDFDDIFG